MKFDKLDYNNSKKGRWFLYGFLMCAVLLIIINMLLTKAKYKVVDSVKLVNSTINYSNADFSLIAIYLQEGTEENPLDSYKKVDNGLIPTDNVKLNEQETYCKIGNEELKGKTTYNSRGINISLNNNTVDFTGIKQAGTKCYLYFDLIKTGDPNTTLANLEVTKTGDLKESVTGPSCANGTNNSSHNGENCALQENGIYAVADDYGTSYVYRGTVNNNWVKFGKTKDNKDIWWRIIRINGNGTIRLIYSGIGSKEEIADTKVPAGMEGTGYWSKAASSSSNSVSQLGTQAYNTSSNDNTYVGFKYGETGQSEYNKTHTNTNKSNIMKYLENWYNGTESFESNGFNSASYKDKIDGSTGFCNDRELATGHSGYTGNGAGTAASAYAPAGRTWGATTSSWNTSGQEPTLKCKNKTRDLFTMSGDEKGDGNGELTVPVGLITSDEVLFAGGFGNIANYGYWLYTGAHYWTMSPYNYYYYSSSNQYAQVFFVIDYGSLYYHIVNGTYGVRPVINLKSNTKFSFQNNDTKGTIDNPYIVQ